MTIDADRRARLERARAEGILRRHFDVDPAALSFEELPFGIAARAAKTAWLVSMSEDPAVLGGMLAWVDRTRPDRVEIVVDQLAGTHARRVAVLAPECRVWAADGDDVRVAEPDAIPPLQARPTDTSALETMLTDFDLEVVCEDGILRGEVAGLEVARIVAGPDGPVIEAGVGRFDREAGALLHGGRTSADALRNVVELVRPLRRSGAEPHAANRLARARWLRHLVVADPSLAGLESAVVVEPIPARESLLENGPASLLGTDSGRLVLAVCSVGSDLGRVPAVADLLQVHGPDLVRLVLPDRDRLPHVERSVARLPLPTEIVTILCPWRR